MFAPLGEKRIKQNKKQADIIFRGVDPGKLTPYQWMNLYPHIYMDSTIGLSRLFFIKRMNVKLEEQCVCIHVRGHVSEYVVWEVLEWGEYI